MKRKLLSVPLAIAAVSTPFAMTIACGKKTENNNNDGGVKGGTKIEGVPALDPYFKEAFTPETLTDRAVEEKDDTFWNGGLVYHAFAQTISILKGLAHEYGYDDAAIAKTYGYDDAGTGLSPKAKFLANTGGKIISDSAADLKIDSKDTDDIKILKTIKSSGATNSQLNGVDLRLRMPDFFGKGGLTEDRTNTTFAIALKYDGDQTLLKDKDTGEKDANGQPMLKSIEDLYFKSFAVYNDPNIPQQLIAQIEDSNDSDELKALREIKLPNMSQLYPKIDDETFFRAKIAPAVQDAFSKVIQILADTSTRSILGIVGVKVQLLFNEIDFLKNIFFTTTTDSDSGVTTYTATDEFISTNFADKLWKLNNGSAHWLAAEVLEKGLDYEFTSEKLGDSEPNDIYEWASEGNSDMMNNVSIGADLPGFSNADPSNPMTILPWTSYGQYIGRSNIYKKNSNAKIDTSTFLAITPSYGFDALGLKKSFDRLKI